MTSVLRSSLGLCGGESDSILLVVVAKAVEHTSNAHDMRDVVRRLMKHQIVWIKILEDEKDPLFCPRPGKSKNFQSLFQFILHNACS